MEEGPNYGELRPSSELLVGGDLELAAIGVGGDPGLGAPSILGAVLRAEDLGSGVLHTFRLAAIGIGGDPGLGAPSILGAVLRANICGEPNWVLLGC